MIAESSGYSVANAGRYAFLILIALVGYFWLPAWWSGKLTIYGDSALHGLPLVWMHANALSGHESLLWSNRIYGGHPLFAEGQGGFASPLNIVSALFFEPVRAMGVLHVLTMTVGGAGVYCLCRILGITRWAATFAAIAVVFSGAWLSNQNDLPAFATLAWAPWLIAAAEFWMRKPSTRRAALLAIPAAFLVFSGYPQISYGAGLYALAALPVQLFCAGERRRMLGNWRPLLATGMLAVVLGIGLAAIQLLPLAELVGYSHRRHGIGLEFKDIPIPMEYFLRGVFYFYFGADDAGSNFPSLTNIAVLLLGGLLLFFRVPARIAGHLLGMALLFCLGLGNTSPLFRFVYEYNLIPGLHFFRVMYPFLAIGVIGLAVAAAFSLDALAGAQPLRAMFRKSRAALWGTALAYGAGLLFLCSHFYVASFGKLIFLAPAAIVIALAILGPLRQRQWLPLLAVLILGADVVLVRAHVFDFYDRKVLEQPQVLRAIASEPDVQEYRVISASIAELSVFMSPTDPEVEKAFRRVLESLSSFTTAMYWKTPAFKGVTALPLYRRMLLTPTLDAEIFGNTSSPPGLRLIDVLGLRYISRDGPMDKPGLSLYAHDPDLSVYIYRNAYAKPRFQVYWDAAAVDTPEQALAGLKAAQSETLFVEKQRGEMLTLLAPPVGCQGCAASKPAIEVVEAKAMRYRVNVDMPREGWLFLADANYPGWQATVNGVRQPVYSAQVLGKAVRLAAGHNTVTIRFVPWSFYIGAALSGLTLVLVLFILLWHPVRKFRSRIARKA